MKESRRVEVEPGAHIGEVDRRRLYARTEASPSMYVYCTDRLHLSEAETYLRIRVARAARKHPAILPMLQDGEAKRFGKTSKPRKSVEEADTSPGSRYISAPVKRFVWKRDGGRCTDLSANGRRCTAREGLEYHHDHPYGRHGDRTAENIRLLCKVQNTLRAERDFGKEAMDRYSRSNDHVSEPLPVYYISADSLRDSNLVQTE